MGFAGSIFIKLAGEVECCRLIDTAILQLGMRQGSPVDVIWVGFGGCCPGDQLMVGLVWLNGDQLKINCS